MRIFLNINYSLNDVELLSDVHTMHLQQYL